MGGGKKEREHHTALLLRYRGKGKEEIDRDGIRSLHREEGEVAATATLSEKKKRKFSSTAEKGRNVRAASTPVGEKGPYCLLPKQTEKSKAVLPSPLSRQGRGGEKGRKRCRGSGSSSS